MSIAQQLKQGDRNIDMPATLELANGEQLICEQVLRFLPNKRIVLKAQWETRLVLIKLILNNQSGHRNLRRELFGYQALKNTKLMIPDLLLTTCCKDSNHVLIFKFINKAPTISQLWQEQIDRRLEIASSMLRLINLIHSNNCSHIDMHLSNFLLVGNQIYVLDMSAIRKHSTTEYGGWQRNNIAFFISRFTPIYQKILINLLDEYYAKAANDPLLKKSVLREWRKYKVYTLKKCFRESSMIATLKNWHRVVTWKRSYHCTDLESFLHNPDGWIDKGELIKDGLSSTVVKVKMGEQWIVIKRYNIKNIFYWLKRQFFQTKSHISWRNAHLLSISGIDTPEPVAFMEKRWWIFSFSGYYLCTFNHALSAEQKYKSQLPTQQELKAFVDLFNHMKLAQLYHRDFKSSNLLVGTQNITLVDLDSIKECTSNKQTHIALYKARERFLRNWQGQPKQYSLFAMILADL